jgi:putative phage-type endonuclease
MDETREIIEAHAEVVMDTSKASRDDWLETRKGGLGGSDAAAALGLSPYKGPFALWSEKTGGWVDDEDNERMFWGRKLELPILEAFAERSGTPVKRYPFMLRSRAHPFMTVNLDGFTDLAVVEAKNVGLRMADEWEDGAVPDHYNLQGQHACVVTGLPGVWFVCLIGGQELRWVYIERDDVLCADLIFALEQFWKLVEGRIAPAVDGSKSTKDALRNRYAESVLERVEVRPIVAQWLLERIDLKAQMKALEAQLDSYENSIKAELGSAGIGTVGGEELVHWRSSPVTRIVPDLVRTLHPEIVAEVSVTKPERRLHVPKASKTALQLMRGTLKP